MQSRSKKGVCTLYTYAPTNSIWASEKQKLEPGPLNRKGICMSKKEVNKAYVKFKVPHNHARSVTKQKFIRYHIQCEA